jgi:hypothetical protein
MVKRGMGLKRGRMRQKKASVCERMALMAARWAREIFIVGGDDE